MASAGDQTDFRSKRFRQTISFAMLPGHCLLCRMPTHRFADICAVCESNLPRVGASCVSCALPLPASGRCGTCQREPPAYTQIIAPFLYRAPIDQLLWSFKYNGNLAVGRVLGMLLAKHLLAAGPLHRDLLVAVPLHWRRLFARGFNQSDELTRTISRALDIPRARGIVRRCRHTATQQGLTRQQRQRNLKGVFTAKKPSRPPSLEGLSVVIIDDVVTTGSTVHALATALQHQGAARVSAWAVARTPLAN